MFSSTRDVKYCQCNRHICPNLFVMDADGRNVLQIGHNNLPELHASLMPDGRILYDRWEYVDRQFGPSFGLWTCNPDGTNHALYYGSNAWSPGAMIDARAIPGSHRVVCIFGSCHDRPWAHWQSSIDDWGWTVPDLWSRSGRLKRSTCSKESTISRWPTSAHSTLSWGLAEVRRSVSAGRRAGRGSGKYFLVSRSMEKPAEGDPRMGIFLVDVFGNELLLHEEEPSCFDPMPLAPAPRPPSFLRGSMCGNRRAISMSMTFTRELGWSRCRAAASSTCGSSRRRRSGPGRAGLRIDAAQAPAMNWNVTVNKRIIGDVPVEDDGSAYFSAPAGRFLYFQALDERKMMVQSMRSGTTLMPGELAGCTGCHESRHTSSSPPTGMSAARAAAQQAQPLVRTAARLQLSDRGPTGLGP